MTRTIFLLCVLHIGLLAYSQGEVSISSPNGKLVFTFKLTDSAPVYKVSFQRTPVLNYSSIQFDFIEGGNFGRHLKVAKPVITEGREVYELVVGKNKKVNSPYRQIVIGLEEPKGLKRKLNLVV